MKTGWWNLKIEMNDGKGTPVSVSDSTLEHIASSLKNEMSNGDIYETNEDGSEESGSWSIDITLEGSTFAPFELSDLTLEHIAQCIIDGYWQGEVIESDNEDDEDNGNRNDSINNSVSPVNSKQTQDTTKQAGCIDVNGKRIDIHKLYKYLETGDVRMSKLFVDNGELFYGFLTNNGRIHVDFMINDGLNYHGASYGHHVGDYANIKNVIRGIIKDVSISGRKLDDLSGIIWDINAAPNAAPVAPQVTQRPVISQPAQQRPVAIKPMAQPKPVTELVALGRFLSIKDNKLLGFHLSNGRQHKEYSVAQCIKLAQAGKIKNIKAVTRNGKMFLAGNGCSLEAMDSRCVDLISIKFNHGLNDLFCTSAFVYKP
jgi:hypothetical protein